jgi:dTDP-4-dehydrorhamnose 3,5-epimerase
VVKGWHYHKKQTDHFVFVKGMAKVVLYDTRDGSKTRGEVNEFFMGEHNPILLVIPPFVLHGMKGIGTEPAYLVNTPTEHYVYGDPDEFRMAPDDPSIPYDWTRKDG